MSVVIEILDKKKNVYVDGNDGITGYGIMTNEPPLDYHITNVEHYEWKRTLTRQAIAMPGNLHPTIIMSRLV